MISSSSLWRIDHFYLPLEIGSLIEQDLEKLEREKQGNDDDEGNKEQDEEQDEDEGEGEGEGNVDAPEKAEGDSANEDIGQPPGSETADKDDEEPRDYFDDEDADPIVLGVRIYTQGGAVVSVTGQVTGEGIDEDSEYPSPNAGKNQEEEEWRIVG